LDEFGDSSIFFLSSKNCVIRFSITADLLLLGIALWNFANVMYPHEKDEFALIIINNLQVLFPQSFSSLLKYNLDSHYADLQFDAFLLFAFVL
jgi:hypothetical protein